MCVCVQSSVITLYTMYLTWSAMTNTPEKICKPDWGSIINNGDQVAPSDEPPKVRETKLEQYIDSRNYDNIDVFIIVNQVSQYIQCEN